MGEPVWTDKEFLRFRIFRLTGAKLLAGPEPLSFDVGGVVLSEFPAVDLVGAVVKERWGSGYYRATLWGDGTPSGQGQTHNVYVDEHGTATRQVAPWKQRKKNAAVAGVVEAQIVDASAIEGEPAPVPVPVADVEPPPMAAPMPAPLPSPARAASLGIPESVRAMLRTVDGEQGIALLLWAQDFGAARNDKHEAMRFAKTVETFDHCAKLQRSAVERILTDNSEINERRASLEIEHKSRVLEYQSKKLELKAARAIEDDATEAQDRIEELEEKLQDLAAATTPAAAAAAGSNLVPLLKAGLPVILGIPAVQAWLKTIHPQAGVLVEAMGPAALDSLAKATAEAAE